MTLPATGAISAADINVELGFSPSATLNITDAGPRSLAGVPSGAISYYDFYGKSSWTWSRPSASSVSGTGTQSNLAYAYDGTGVGINNSTCAVIGHQAPGTWPQTETVTYNGFGTGTHTGHIYIACSGSLVDTAVGAYATLDIKVNGVSVSGFPLDSSGTTAVTFSYLASGALSVALTGQDLSTLTVAISATGGHVGSLGDGDNASCVISVYDILFKA